MSAGGRDTKKNSDHESLKEEIEKVPNRLDATLSENDRRVFAGLLARHGEVKVCANCGSLEIGIPPFKVDASVVAYRETWRYYCAVCAYEGIPLIFNDLAAYEEFFRERRINYNKGIDIIEPNYLLPASFGDPGFRKKPYVAVLLSLLLPGLGQAYNGEKEKAAKIFTVFVASVALMFIGIQMTGIMGPGAVSSMFIMLSLLGLGALALIFIYTVSDAYIAAKKKAGQNRNGKNTETVRFNITANASLANYVVNDNDPRMYGVRAAPGSCAVSVPLQLAGVDLFE